MHGGTAGWARGRVAAKGLASTTTSVGTPVRAAIATLSFGAAAIHASVIGGHARESWLYGDFFVAVASLQVGWGALVLLRPTRRIIVLGSVGSGALVLTWLVSRTAGIPIGPNGGGREPLGLLDSVATAFELGILVAAIVLIRSQIGQRSLPRSGAILSGVAVSLGVAGLTVASLLARSARVDLAPAARRSDIGISVRPHLVHFVLFLCAAVAVAVYSMMDRRKMREDLL